MTRVPLLLLLAATTAFAQIPAERPASIPIPAPAPGMQESPAVASDGNQYLAVWFDPRGGPNLSGIDGGVIYASRLDENGHVLDPTGIRIGGSPPSGSMPAVLFAGDTWSVFWNEVAFDGAQNTTSIHVARVDRNGNVVDPPHRLIDGSSIVPSLAASSGDRMAIFTGSHLTILDAAAHVIGQSIPLGVNESGIGPSGVASNGRGFLAVWGASAFSSVEIDAQELDLDGNALGKPLLLAANVRGFATAVASNGRDYLIAYHDGQQDATIAVSGTTHAFAGANPVASTPYPTEAVLVPTSMGYVLARRENNMSEQRQAIFTQRLDPNGVPFDPDTELVAEAPFGLVSLFAAATNGRTIQYVRSSTVPGSRSQFDIHGMSVGAIDQRLTQEVLVSQSANTQQSPAIAFSGQNYLIVTREADGIYASRLSLDGQPLDGRGVRVSDSTSYVPPKVIFDGVNFMVLFEKTPTAGLSELLAERIDPSSGNLLDGDGAPIATSKCETPFDIGFDGSETLAVRSTCPFTSTASTLPQLNAIFVNRSAQPIGTESVITPANLAAYDPSVAWSGSEWLVAFSELKYQPCSCLISPPPLEPTEVNVMALRLSSEGTPLDTQPIPLTDATIADPRQQPHVASSGHDFLVTWTRHAANEAEARNVALDGTLGATSEIGGGIATSTIRTETGYVTALTTPDGIILTNGMIIGPGDSAMLVGADGRITAAYERLAVEPAYGGVERVFVRDAQPQHGRAAGR